MPRQTGDGEVKCPRCNAWTIVKDTRNNRRRRECANLHRFWTLELLEEVALGLSNTASKTDTGMSLRDSVLAKLPKILFKK